MECSSCEHQNEDGALFCSRCGGQIAVAETEDSGALDDDRFVEFVREKLVGQYQILGVLGRGGMAYVFEAIEHELDRKVALKVLPMEHTYSEDLVRRFKREAKLAAGLHHPHIIPIYRVGSSGRVHYFTMAYMQGGSLEERVRDGMYISDSIEIIKQVADALAYAHSKKLIHRDIKPANIMFDIHGSAYVADFGIAKAAAHTITATRSFFGTPHYMSPEQVVDDRIDGRADLYALGVLFYQMTTGQYPFDGKEALAVMYKHVNLEPEAPTVIHSKVPIEVSRIILKLLAKDPEKRYQTGDQLLQDLEALDLERDFGAKRITAGLVNAPPKNPDIARTLRLDGEPPPPQRRTTTAIKSDFLVKQNRKPLLAAGLAGFAFVVLMIFLLLPDSESTRRSESDLSPIENGASTSPGSGGDPVVNAQGGESMSSPENQAMDDDEVGFFPANGVMDLFAPADQAAENFEAPKEPLDTGFARAETRIQETTASPSTSAKPESEQVLTEDKAVAKLPVKPPAEKGPEPKPSTKITSKKRDPIINKADDASKSSIDMQKIERIADLIASMGLVAVPGGSFEMGNNSILNRAERPAHQVAISPFKIGRTEVTQALWLAVMGENPSCHQGDEQPVENVSWEDVRAFLSRLNRILGATYRLPTEAEWEYVCNRGNYNEEIGAVAWYSGNSGNRTHPAAAKASDAEGVFDLKGNVWEWCADWYDRRFYRDSPARDPRGPETGAERVIRGGGWDAKSGQCRCYKRESMAPSAKKCSVGFRIVDPLPDRPPETAPH